MESPFDNTQYRRLFSAQVLSLLGTGVTTVALALLAVGLAGEDAGTVLGTALALKMAVYVVGAPLISRFAQRFQRKPWLVSLDLLRAALVLCLPFVTAAWQIYVLVVLINACAASFTPVFQATVPTIFRDEAVYQKALSWAQTAYALEQLASPMIAALILVTFHYHVLFNINVLTFLASALLILWTDVPATRPGFQSADRLFGLRAYLRTPRLRATWFMYFAVAAASAMVIVNTAVYVMTYLSLSESALALALAASGAGSMLGALSVPRLLDRFTHRAVMLSGCVLLTSGLAIGTTTPAWFGLLPIWFVLGYGLTLVQTPVGALVRRSCTDRDSAALFAANFSLSHACWFFAYLLAGYLGAYSSWHITFAVLATIACVATFSAWRTFPSPDPLEITHTHDVLEHASDHEHDSLHDSSAGDSQHRHEPVTHTHHFVIDEHHPSWVYQKEID